MASPVPENWQACPPESFVAGEGAYALALALIFKTIAIPPLSLLAGPAPDEEGDYPYVLKDLQRAFVVIEHDTSSAEAIRLYRAVWLWVARLTPLGDQHSLAIFFVLPPDVGGGFERLLEVSLNAAGIDPATTGYATWRRTKSFASLLHLIAGTTAQDSVVLRNLQTIDRKRASLARLARAGLEDASLQDAARDVLAAFSEQEHHLDLFCKPPSHQNGRLLRDWLHRTATASPVPPDSATLAAPLLAEWLLESQAP